LVGEILRKKREDQGVNLREIAETLKIGYDYLKAIEEEDFKKIPAEVYTRGYILEYAKILNIDPDVIIKAYEQQVSPPQTAQSNKKEIENLRKKRAKIKYLLIPSFLILLMIITVFALFQSPHKKSMPPVASIDEKIVNNLPFPSSSEEDIGDTSYKSSPLEENFEHILEILATDTTWILATMDKKDSREVLMKQGESVKWHAKNCFALKIGNAGGVKLFFNGKEIQKLGEKGQVITIEIPDANSDI
jgi:cytoskeletal protein RodZ